MEKAICAGKCPFYTNVPDGTAEGERKFKYREILSGRSKIVGCLCNMRFVFATFCGYTRDEHGEIDGAVFSCDLGHGYGFDDGEETITMHQISQVAGVVHYEFMCSLHHRMPRYYIRGGKVVDTLHYLPGK